MSLKLRPTDRLALEITQRGSTFTMELAIYTGAKRTSMGKITAKNEWTLYTDICRFFQDRLADEGLERMAEAQRRE